MPPLANKQIVEQLSRSKIYQDYEQAFNRATGLPLKLRPTAQAPAVMPAMKVSSMIENE